MKYYLAIFIALLTSTFTLAAYEPTIHTGTTENVSPRKVVHVMKQVDDTYGGIVVLEDGSAWRDYWEFKPISVGDTLESSDGIHFNNASDQVTYSLKYIGKIDKTPLSIEKIYNYHPDIVPSKNTSSYLHLSNGLIVGADPALYREGEWTAPKKVHYLPGQD